MPLAQAPIKPLNRAGYSQLNRFRLRENLP
jgi:hypothetical protein